MARKKDQVSQEIVEGLNYWNDTKNNKVKKGEKDSELFTIIATPHRTVVDLSKKYPKLLEITNIEEDSGTV